MERRVRARARRRGAREWASNLFHQNRSKFGSPQPTDRPTASTTSSHGAIGLVLGDVSCGEYNPAPSSGVGRFLEPSRRPQPGALSLLVSFRPTLATGHRTSHETTKPIVRRQQQQEQQPVRWPSLARLRLIKINSIAGPFSQGCVCVCGLGALLPPPVMG